MPFLAVCYRPESKPDSICGGYRRKGDLQFTSRCEQIGEMYWFCYSGYISPQHPRSHTSIRNIAETPNTMWCTPSFAHSFRTLQEWCLSILLAQHPMWDCPSLTLPLLQFQPVLSPCADISVALQLPQGSRSYLHILHQGPHQQQLTQILWLMVTSLCVSYVVLVRLGRSFDWKPKSEETKMDVPFISQIWLEVHVAATDLQVDQHFFFNLFSVLRVIFGQECYSLSVWAPLEASSSCEPWTGSLSSLQVLCGKLSVPRRMSQVFAHMKFIPCYFRKKQRGS